MDDVMRRYSPRDRRSARRLMDEAGGFMIAGRLVIRRDHLLAHEPLPPGWWREEPGGDRDAA